MAIRLLFIFLPTHGVTCFPFFDITGQQIKWKYTWLSRRSRYPARLNYTLTKLFLSGTAKRYAHNLFFFKKIFLYYGIWKNKLCSTAPTLKEVLNFVEYLFIPIVKLVSRITQGINDVIDRITSQEFVFFTRGDNQPNLNRVLLYIKNNDHTKKIKFVTVQSEKDEEFYHNLHKDIQFLDQQYPEILTLNILS